MQEVTFVLCSYLVSFSEIFRACTILMVCYLLLLLGSGVVGVVGNAFDEVVVVGGVVDDGAASADAVDVSIWYSFGEVLH